MLRYFIIGLLTVLTGSLFPSAAQVQVIGSTLGKDCYTAVKGNTKRLTSQLSICDDAIESDTLARNDLAATHMNRGIVLMRMQALNEALADYEKARSLRPNLGAIYLNEGAALISAGRLEDAISTLERAIELETQDPHAAHYNLGLAHELTGDVTSAYYAFSKALELRPDWSLALKQLERYSVVSEG